MEVDVFLKDDGGDTNAGKEVEVEVSDKERVLKEDDVFEDYYSLGVPTDLEADPRLKIFLGKLKTRWSGPFTITHVFPYGTTELSQIGGQNFKVNGHRIKHYFGEDIPKMVIPDLQTFPKGQTIWGLGQAERP
nr:reverse transcriptase domain-containing protein [Tanacetum cinerariifolium]